MTKNYSFTVDENSANSRLDKFLAEKLKEELISREKIKQAILEGNVKVSAEKITAPRHLLKQDEEVQYTTLEEREHNIVAKEMPIDIVYEDDDLLVINKQAGLTVHPGAGNSSDTLVNGLLAYNKDNLSQIGGSERPGIVHRLDKNTSGLMIVAKNDKAHLHLSEQLQQRSLKRKYFALVWGMLKPDCGTIDANIARSNKNRKLMDIAITRGKKAVTHYQTEEVLLNGLLSLVECELETGRTHQIRVHMSSVSHAIFGDPEYGQHNRKLIRFFDEVEDEILYNFKRQALQAYHIRFEHPTSGEEMEFESPLADDFCQILDYLREKS